MLLWWWVPLGLVAAQAWRGPLSCSSHRPECTITPVVEVADTAPAAASVTVTAATLETGPTERVGTPLAKHPAVQQQQQGPATTIVEGGGGDAAAAAALMSLKLGKR